LKIARFKHTPIDFSNLIGTITNGELAKGEKIEEFEKNLSKFLKCKNVCLVSNGFSAIYLSLKSIGVKSGDKVLLPAVSTCHSVRNAVTAIGAIPVYIDIKRNLPVVDYKIQEIKNHKIKAVVSINHFGIDDQPENLNNNILIIKDISQCFGVKHSNMNADCFVSSFYMTKILASIDGGIIFSESNSIIEECKDLRSYDNKFDEKQRFNFKLNNINAAYGISQLENIESQIESRKKISERYIDIISKSSLINSDIYNQIKLYYKFPILFEDKSKIESIVNEINKLNIPLTKEFIFNSKEKIMFPNGESLVERFYSIPCYPGLNDLELNYISNVLKKFFN